MRSLGADRLPAMRRQLLVPAAVSLFLTCAVPESSGAGRAGLCVITGTPTSFSLRPLTFKVLLCL